MLSRFAFRIMTIVAALVAAGSVHAAFAQDQGTARLADIYAQFQKAQDPERIIALGEAALASEAATSQWTLATSRDALRTDVHAGLGRAYVNRAGGVRADNIEAAIRHFSDALSSSKDADETAALHTNLAIAYWNRIRGDRVESEDRALSHFESAMTTFTRERNAVAWAQINSNMAALVLTRHRGSRDANVEQSIGYLEQALSVLTKETQPQLWAAAHNNLGNAYRIRKTGTAADNVTAATRHFEQALAVFTREAAPFQWAQIQVAIAAILRNGGTPADQITAIQRLRDVLSVFTLDAYPHQWAQVQYELGNALSDAAGDDGTGNRTEAVLAYRAALSVLTLQAAPLNHLQIARRLANVYLRAGDCAAAKPFHASAREAFLVLFGEGLDTAETASLAMEAGPMFADAAYCAVERGEIAEAVQLANEGRARVLSVSLKLQSLDLPPEQKQKFDDLRAAIRTEQVAVDTATGAKRTEALDRLAGYRTDLVALIESSAETAHPPGSALAGLDEAAGKSGAILMPVITSKGAKLLLFAGARVKTWTALDFPDVTLARVSEILAGNGGAGPQAHGWIEAYFANYFQDDEQQKRWPRWLEAIDGMGVQLWTLFGEKLTHELKSAGTEPGSRLILMPSGRLGVLPLGLAQDPVSKRRLLDSYDITYAPSLEALIGASRQIAASQPASLAAVINPTGDLPGTEKEGAIVAAHFPIEARTVLQRTDATVAAVLDALKGRAYWHFASHGTFAWQNVTNSALIMSGGERLSISRLAEADNLGHPRLVVLSACETGLSDIVTENPDEFIGLPGSFVGLGAAGVVGTLWPVSDDATALLIAKFYDLHLVEGVAPPAALRQAQLWLRDATTDDLNRFARAQKLEQRHVTDISQSLDRLSASTRLGVAAPSAGTAKAPATVGATKPYAHPYYWGGFVYTGL